MQQFSFIFPISQPVKDTSRREGVRYEHVADWLISGNCCRRLTLDEIGNYTSGYEYKINEIVYPGTDTHPVFEGKEILNAVNAACLNHVQSLFTNEGHTRKIPAHHKIGTLIGKVIPIQRMFRKVK